MNQPTNMPTSFVPHVSWTFLLVFVWCESQDVSELKKKSVSSFMEQRVARLLESQVIEIEYRHMPASIPGIFVDTPNSPI